MLIFLTSLIRNTILRFSFIFLFHYWYTKNIVQSLIFTITTTIIAWLLNYTYELFEPLAPKPLGNPLHNIDLTGGSGSIAEVRVQADTPQDVLYSEQDDPDKPDDIDINPYIPVIDLEKTKEWAKERQFRQAMEILKEEPQLGIENNGKDTPALEPETFTSLFYY